mmetsp:Transcript_10067/g.41552  ORF Transcript_10067/g.41552 Transcript_10067/m.41552 type:complete len:270 (+) Transcript_10067:480-1289(+)
MRESLTHCTFTSSTSKMSVALPGMAPFTPFLPYAMAGGMVSRRLSPTRMPATPTSQPLMTSPMPSLNWNVALPLVWSKILPLWSLPTYFIVTLLPGSAFLPPTWPIATLRISMPFLNSRLSCLPPEAGVSGLGASFFFSSFFSFLAGGSSFLAGGSSGAARFFFSSFLAGGLASSSSISSMVTPPFLVFFGASSSSSDSSSSSSSSSSSESSKSPSSSSSSKSSRTPKSSASSSESYSSSSSSESSSSSSPIWRSYIPSISSSSMSGMK